MKERKNLQLWIGLFNRIGAITFYISGFLMDVIQTILYIIIMSFNKDLFRRINKYFNAAMYSHFLFIPDWLSNFELTIYADPYDYQLFLGKERAFCIMNHSYEVDWLMNLMLCDKFKCLGSCKAITKKQAKYLPVVGWNWLLADFIFLERCYEKDVPIIKRQFNKLGSHPKPIWLIFHPEGTRYTPEKHKHSIEFAKSKNLPVYKHHLLPRTKGYLTALPLMVDKFGGLYDIVLAFKGGKEKRPTIKELLDGKMFSAHVYIRRIPFNQVPQEQEQAVKFLYDMYTRKDKLLDSFYKTDDFFAESGIEKLEPIKIRKSYTSLINFFLWNSLLTLPLIWYWLSLLSSGEYLIFSFITITFIIANIFWSYTMNYASIGSSSNYGMEMKKPN